ncbi:hypothetical protein CTI12_AA292260 [Artemisia annua]|uniref:3,4-dihydroxy-2-butanone-4-phosphate synthase n=1 Tax=Artemisia annua TaxID=35608 RepID=A0A2U1N971_ARTAN|nr:hypothetical protein CTI12_AA292260 [Artemisia annua]
MVFFVKHGTGIVCVSMKVEDLERLQLPLMVTHNEKKLCTTFTVSVDAKHGISTGVSGSDRATTIKAIASKDSNPDYFNRPVLGEVVDDDGSMARLPKLKEFFKTEY